MRKLMLLYYGFGKYAPVAQPVEHLTFNQGVRDSNSRRSTKKRDTLAVSLFLVSFRFDHVRTSVRMGFVPYTDGLA